MEKELRLETSTFFQVHPTFALALKLFIIFLSLSFLAGPNTSHEMAISTPNS